MIRRFFIVSAAVFVVASGAAAAAGRGDDLKSLARIFGQLHHIRRTCEPQREADVWRDRMRRMIELEEPYPTLRTEMIEAFNGGFRDAQARFPYCDRDARDAAAASARDAEDVTTRLITPLYDSLSDQSSAPVSADNVVPSGAPLQPN